MLGDDRNHTSLIFQRLKAQESLNELQRQRMRHRIATNIRTIWSESSFLFRTSVLGLVLGITIAFLIPARYTATTRLMAPDNQPGSTLAATATALAATRGAGGLGEVAWDMLGLKNTSEVFAGILASRTVQNYIIDKFDLKRVYGVSRLGDARNELSRFVGVAIDRKNQMITISVTDRSPQRAVEMAAAYPDELNRLVSDLSTSSARRERIFLEGRMSQVSQDLENAERDFSQFASKNSAIDIKEQGKSMLEVAGTLQGRLISAESELEGLRQIYSDSHIRIKTQKARVEELQSQLAKIGGNEHKTTLGADSTAADFYPSIRKLPLLGVTYADLYRSMKLQEAVFEVLTQESELAKVQDARETPSVKVLDPPELPEAKDFPPRKLIAMSSTGIAFVGGVIVLLATKSWNEKDPDDLSKAIANEIWVDLKEKRFLNAVKPMPVESELDRQSSIQLKRGILSFLGWNKGLRAGNDCSSFSHYASTSQHSGRNTSENSGQGDEHGLRGTA